jgi:hypothetical protein
MEWYPRYESCSGAYQDLCRGKERGEGWENEKDEENGLSTEQCEVMRGEDEWQSVISRGSKKEEKVSEKGGGDIVKRLANWEWWSGMV